MTATKGWRIAPVNLPYWTRYGLVAWLIVWPLHEIQARVKLITLPVREKVEIQLDNQDATLVEEERLVPLIKGENQVDFSWANTAIDADSIVFRVMDEDGSRKVNILSVSYPPGENALVWRVFASAAGAARVRISYLLHNLDREYHYRAVAANDERKLTLSQYIRIRNASNEVFGEASIWTGSDDVLSKPLGLSETKEVLVERYRGVPIQKTYTASLDEFGFENAAENKLRVALHYVLTNDRDNKMGQSVLPYGKARIFQQDSQGTTAFLGEDWAQYTPPGDKMRLFLGLARDVVVKRVVERNERRKVDGNLFHQHIVLKYDVENFKNAPVTLTVAEAIDDLHAHLLGRHGRPIEWQLGPDTSFSEPLDLDRTNAKRVVMQASLPPADEAGKAEKTTLRLHLIFRNEW